MAIQENDALIAKKEFAELALNRHNFLTWAMNLKVSLPLHGMFKTIEAPK
jgi:hypothetical protein